MNILVTGSEGNLGTYIRKFIRMHFPDAVIYGTKRSEKYHVEKIGEKEYRIECELTSFEDCSKLFSLSVFEYVINCAALLFGVAGFNKKQYDIFFNDVIIQLNLTRLSLMQNKKPKYIYISSSMVYENAEEIPFYENIAHKISPPNTSYGMTKYIGEKILFYADGEFGINYTIWRPFNIVSPLEEKREKGYSHVFVDFAYDIFKNKKREIQMLGDGLQTRCFTWVEDVASFIVKNITDEKTDKRIFNIGNTEEITIKKLGELLVNIGIEEGYFPKDYTVTFLAGDCPKKDVKLRVPSIEKVILLGFKSTYLKDTFKKFLVQGGYINKKREII